jgi:flagellar motor switch protein FliN/FliY
MNSNQGINGVNHMENVAFDSEELSVGTRMENPVEEFAAKAKTSHPTNLDLLMDVSLRVSVELGRTRMQLAQILELQHGSVIELDRMAGDPVDIFVNDLMVARGEVVIVDDKFGVRITEMIPSRGGKVSLP